MQVLDALQTEMDSQKDIVDSTDDKDDGTQFKTNTFLYILAFNKEIRVIQNFVILVIISSRKISALFAKLVSNTCMYNICKYVNTN